MQPTPSVPTQRGSWLSSVTTSRKQKATQGAIRLSSQAYHIECYVSSASSFASILETATWATRTITSIDLLRAPKRGGDIMRRARALITVSMGLLLLSDGCACRDGSGDRDPRDERADRVAPVASASISQAEFVRLHGALEVDLSGDRCEDVLDEIARCEYTSGIPILIEASVVQDLRVTYARRTVLPRTKLLLTDALLAMRIATACAFGVEYRRESIIIRWPSR